MDLFIPPKYSKNYFLKDEIIIHKQSYHLLKNIDTIIFDIDGVLLDVYSSFRKATSLAVQFYFKKILNFKGKIILLPSKDTELFKITGKFNDDHNLTKGAVYFFLAQAIKNNCSTLKEITFTQPLLKDFLVLVKNAGGGLINLKKLVNKMLNVKEFQLLKKNYFEEEIVNIVSEIYAGKNTQKVYGFKPKYFKNVEGLGKKEKVILKQKLNPNFKYAILTGRNSGETKLALNNLTPYLKIPKKYILCSDNNIQKPSAKPLQILTSKLNSKVAVYLGDTLDDLTCVNMYNKKKQKTKIFSSQILTKLQVRKKVKLFMENKVSLIAKNVNDILNLINKENIKGKN